MDLKEAMNTALEFERKGEAYYREAANKTDNPIVRDIFLYLASQEVLHEKEIQNLIDKSEISMEGDQLPEVKNFFTMKTKEFKEKLELSDDDIKAYETAMQMEKESYNYYKEKYMKAQEDVKEFLDFLMRQESAHYELIRNALEFLRDPASYHMQEEDWHFEG